jgi:integrase
VAQGPGVDQGGPEEGEEAMSEETLFHARLTTSRFRASVRGRRMPWRPRLRFMPPAVSARSPTRRPWKAERHVQGAKNTAPFDCSVQSHRHGRPLQRAALRRRFLTACKVLALVRLRTLTIHHGRHTYISQALANRRTLAEVRAAAGHAGPLTTSVYLHVAVDDDGELGHAYK